MITCPMSNFIGNRCMPDPVEPPSLPRQAHDFAEEATFFAALYRQHPVRPVPDPTLLLVLNKQWLAKKNRTVSKKDAADKLGLGKKPHGNAQPEHDEPEEA